MARTLIVQHWTFHTAYARESNRQDYPPSNLQGIDILEFIATDLASREPFDFEDRQRWVRVDKVRSAGARSLLINATAGRYGEMGDVVNRVSGEVDFELTTEHAPTTPTRTLVVAPATGLSALAFYERSTGRGASGLDLQRALHSSWRQHGNKITWKTEWLQNGDVWLREGTLKAVQVRRYADTRTDHPAAGSPQQYVYMAKAGRRRAFPRSLFDRIVENPQAAADLVGVEFEEGDKTYVEMKLNGAQKTFAVDGGQLPKLQEELPDQLSDSEFVEHCTRVGVEQLSESLGFSWRHEWVDLSLL